MLECVIVFKGLFLLVPEKAYEILFIQNFAYQELFWPSKTYKICFSVHNWNNLSQEHFDYLYILYKLYSE